MAYYTRIDRSLNVIKRKGFFVFTGIVVASVAYSMYQIGNLPDLNEQQEKSKGKDKAKTKKSSGAKSEPHPTDNWSKSQLYAYLTTSKVYLDVDAEVDVVRKAVRVLYDRQDRDIGV